MAPDTKRLATLARLKRVADAEKRRAIGDLAEARDTEARISRLAERSQALANAYPVPIGTSDGQSLRQLVGFGTALGDVALQLEGSREDAGAQVGKAEQALASTDGRLARIDDKLRNASRLQDRKRSEREFLSSIDANRDLARRLQS